MSIDAPTPKTRDRILLILKMKGSRTASDLAEELGVTTMAIRQHLAGLDTEGLLESREERRPVGRPTRLWSLSREAEDRFPAGYADLAVEVIDSVRDTLGEEALDKVIRSRIERQIIVYRERMGDQIASLEDRLARLVELRKQDGFLSEWRRNDDGSLQLIENHCPVRQAAERCQGLCDGEIDLFRSVLGPNVAVDREQHMLGEDRHCTYCVRAIKSTEV